MIKLLRTTVGRFLPWAFGLVIALPAFALAAEAEGGHEPALAELIPGLLIKIVNFAVLAYLLVRFLSKPLADYLRSRSEAVRVGLDDLGKRRELAEKDLREYGEKVRTIDEQIRRSLAEARVEMERERQEIILDARKTAGEIMDHARETMQREFAKSRADLHAEAVNVSMALAEEFVRKNITPQDQQRFADDYIHKIAGSL